MVGLGPQPYLGFLVWLCPNGYLGSPLLMKLPTQFTQAWIDQLGDDQRSLLILVQGPTVFLTSEPPTVGDVRICVGHSEAQAVQSLQHLSSNGHSALIEKQDQVCPSLNIELFQKARNEEFHSSLRNMQVVGNLLVGKAFQHVIENLLFAHAETGGCAAVRGAASLLAEDRIQEAG